MEKDRNNKLLAVIALVVAVIGLTIGFAGWSTSLSITDARANVTAGEDANFKSNIKLASVSCTPSGDATVESAGSLNTATDTWSGIRATLTKTGDKVTCAAVINNTSDYIAYINDVIIASNGITCTGEGQNVASACNAMQMNVSVQGTKTSTATTMGSTTVNATDISDNSIAKTNGTASIIFDISYEGEAVADTDFVATMPDVTFNIDTVD